MTLNLKKVILYRCGIGSFQGKCSEPEFILPINENDINDVLKSLSASGLSSARFNTAEEAERVIEKLGLSIDSSETFTSLCGQLIGLEVSIKTKNGKEHSGIILGLDEIQDNEALDEEKADEARSKCLEVLVLKTAEKVLYFGLQTISEIEPKDSILQKDLQSLLAFISRQRKKSVIDLRITAEKDASINWSMPVSSWRLSYRLFNRPNENLLDLYGYAIIDNTSSLDWKDVVLRLVTGKPVSFQYDLFTPLTIQRPEIEPQIEGAKPLISEAGAVFDMDKGVQELEESLYAKEEAMTPEARPRPKKMAAAPGSAPRMSPQATRGRIPSAPPPEEVKPQIESKEIELGLELAYEINYPITLNRSQSAVLPILHHELTGHNCVIVRSNKPSQAMDAFLLDEPIDLETGVVTVYSDNSYAGDSMLVQGTKIIAFRLNPEIHVIMDTKTDTTTKGLAIEGKYLRITKVNELTFVFKINNQTESEHEFILEIEKQTNYRALEKPFAETPNYYRYMFTLPKEQAIKELSFEKITYQRIYLANLTQNQLEYYAKRSLLKDDEEEQLAKLIKMFQELEKYEDLLEKKNGSIEGVFREQERLRETITVLQEEDPARERYLTKFRETEEQLQELLEEKTKLEQELAELQEKLNDWKPT
jgi:hypothetical protein